MTRDGLIFVHPSDEIYGADRMLMEFVRALPNTVRGGAECWLPTDLDHPDLSLCDELDNLDIRVRHLDLPILRRSYRTPAALARLVGRMHGLRSALSKHAPRMVYCTTSAAFLAAPVARSVGVPLVVGHLQEIWSARDRVLLSGPARACHRLLAISSAVVQPLPPGLVRRTTIVPNSTPAPDDLIPLDSRAGELTFVVAARWNGWKGHETLLAAWDQVDSPGQLVVLGGPPLSGERTDVVGFVERLRAPGTVQIVGERPDISSYINHADVLIAPSDQPEPFGLVAIEAFARGRPVIASDAGGHRDIVTDGRDGWLFPPRDIDALAALIDGLDRTTVTRAGQEARHQFEKRFTSERFSQRWRAALSIT